MCLDSTVAGKVSRLLPAKEREAGGAERLGGHRQDHLSVIERGERNLALDMKMSGIVASIENALGEFR